MQNLQDEVIVAGEVYTNANKGIKYHYATFRDQSTSSDDDIMMTIKNSFYDTITDEHSTKILVIRHSPVWEIQT